MTVYLTLFWEFFKTGLFSIGGGLATLPFLRNISEKFGWYSLDELANMLAVSESTPGPIGVNMATFAGFNVAYILGAIVASLAIVTPSVITICIIARFLKKYRTSPLVNGVFYALKPASAAIVTSAVLNLFLSAIINAESIGSGAALSAVISLPTLLLFSIAFVAVLLFSKKIHPIIFIGLGAVAGIILKL